MKYFGSSLVSICGNKSKVSYTPEQFARMKQVLNQATRESWSGTRFDTIKHFIGKSGWLIKRVLIIEKKYKENGRINWEWE